jgi:hypothetical protein
MGQICTQDNEIQHKILKIYEQIEFVLSVACLRLQINLANMLIDFIHALCNTVVSILALTTDNPIYLLSTKGSRQV